MDYEKMGEHATYEARLAAARLSIALTFGIDWNDKKTVTYVAAGSERLAAFSGPEAFEQAGDEVDIMSMPTDAAVQGLVMPAVKYFKEHFPMDDTPPGRSYWLEVLRYGRKAAEASA